MAEWDSNSTDIKKYSVLMQFYFTSAPLLFSKQYWVIDKVFKI